VPSASPAPTPFASTEHPVRSCWSATRSGVGSDPWWLSISGNSGAAASRTDAFAGFAGNYWITSGENETELRDFFGGTPDQTSAARAASNPFTYGDGDRMPVRLVAGTADETVDNAQSRQLYDFLAGKGWDVQLTMVPGGNHMSVLTSAPGYEAVRQAFLAAICQGSGCSAA
jgi:dipeptidyl aminopeptidase/acylaminoacyl peptidase